MAYIFGGNTGIRTPEEAARLRAVAEALATHGRAPQNIGEGLSAIGDAIASRRYRMRGERMESEGRAGWQSKYGNLLSELMGGGGAVDPVPTAPDLSQANPEYLTGGGMPPPPTMENVANASLAAGDASISSYSPPDDATAGGDAASAMANGQPDIQTAGISIEPSPQEPAPQQQPGVQLAGGAGFDPRIAEALSDPWLPEGQKAVLQAILEQQLKANEPADPFTLSAGQVRYGPTGQEIARGPEKEPDLPGGVREYQFAVSQGFPGTFQDWEASKKGGMSLQIDPATGAVSFQQGGNIKPLTEGQSKDTVYATRATGALPLIDQYGAALTNLGETVGGGVPIIGNYMKSAEFQQAEQAGREFVAAVVRKDTGAAVTASEMKDYGGMYLPQPGDKPPVLEQKRIARLRALEAIKAGMPPQAILAMEKAGEKVGEAAPAPAPAPEASDIPEGVDPEVWKAMTPEERALWQ